MAKDKGCVLIASLSRNLEVYNEFAVMEWNHRAFRVSREKQSL